MTERGEGFPLGDRMEPADYEAHPLQWVFNNPDIRERFGQHINTDYLIRALNDLKFASAKKPGNPKEVLLAWKVLYDVIGRYLMAWFIESSEWEKWARRPSYVTEANTRMCVWEQDGERVMIYLKYMYEEPIGFDFGLE